MRQPIPTPPHVDVWDEFKQDFIQDWDDMNTHYKAATELNKLKMEGSNIDHYIIKFYYDLGSSLHKRNDLQGKDGSTSALHYLTNGSVQVDAEDNTSKTRTGGSKG